MSVLTRIAKFLLTKLGRVVFLFISITVFCCSILLLENFADSRSVWAFDCNSKIYQFEMVDNVIMNHQHEPLYLSLTVQNKQINLDYYTAEKEGERELVSLKGKLKELEIGKLMYQLDLKITDAQYQLDDPQLQDYLVNELDEVKSMLVTGSDISVALQVLEMDTKKDFILIKFSPYNTLWACRLHD
ncbi:MULTISPECIES: hypothetical protein [Shewanella]|uniref:hypothetical protein n=1 Tax=Shewanella TaxID=22 RepID=UPI001BBB2B4E|nr:MULTISPECIES: hypothetical protein [Shewanella]GIU52301.1 hypothetical protein TUM4249_21360 [Shewanella sp. KT0246]